MIMGVTSGTNGNNNEIVEPTFTMTKMLDDERLIVELLQDLGLANIRPENEIIKVNSKVLEIFQNNDKFGPIDGEEVMRTNHVP